MLCVCTHCPADVNYEVFIFIGQGFLYFFKTPFRAQDHGFEACHLQVRFFEATFVFIYLFIYLQKRRPWRGKCRRMRKLSTLLLSGNEYKCLNIRENFISARSCCVHLISLIMFSWHCIISNKCNGCFCDSKLAFLPLSITFAN